QILDLDGASAELDLAAGRARGRQRDQLTDREATLGQDVQHGFADRTGGADDGDGETTFCSAHGCFSLIGVIGMGGKSRALRTDRPCSGNLLLQPLMERRRRLPIVWRWFF